VSHKTIKHETPYKQVLGKPLLEPLNLGESVSPLKILAHRKYLEPFWGGVSQEGFIIPKNVFPPGGVTTFWAGGHYGVLPY